MPSIRAPISTSIVQRSTISGSRATLSTTVVPCASVAAMTRFSVAPTLGKSSHSGVPTQPVGDRRDDVPVLDLDLGAQVLQTADVHVQAAGADVVAARQRHLGATAARDERAEHADGGAQPPDQVVRRVVAEVLGHVDVDLLGREVEGHGAAELLEQPGHHGDVEDVGQVGDRGGAGRQQRGRHELQGAVLRPAHPHRAVQGRAVLTAGDDEGLHQVALPPSRRRPRRARPASHSSVSRGLAQPQHRRQGGVGLPRRRSARRLLAKERKCQATIDSREKV